MKNRKLKAPLSTLIVIGLSAMAIAIGSDKSTPSKLFSRWLMFGTKDSWELQTQDDDLTTATIALTATQQALDASEELLDDADVCYISFDWHIPNRHPNVDGRQNVMGWVVKVAPTNINGRVYEDHYVAFSAQAADQPSVLLIEYAKTLEDGTIQRYLSDVVTNSYPDKITVALDSGNHECYWFRSEVPEPFINEPRDWNGELLFGAPIDSGRGFDLSGILVVDDGNEVWVGDSGLKAIDGINYVFTNGICIGVAP